MPSSRRGSLLDFYCLLLSLISFARAYQVPIQDADYSRQVCSGMWGGDGTYINVTFDTASRGHVAMVIYEWADASYLGIATDPNDEYVPKTYVCTSSAVTLGYCSRDQLGRFILNLPPGKSINETSFWSEMVQLPGTNTTTTAGTATGKEEVNPLWNNPSGTPTPPPSNYSSPWKRQKLPIHHPVQIVSRQNTTAHDIIREVPIHYSVQKTGYYCVAVIPITMQSTTKRRALTDVPFHPSYHGVVLFKNKFEGQLPATDYPKVNFYFIIFLAYTIFAAAWAIMCYQHIHELLPIQHYLSGLVALLVIEMVANWGYYRYLNAHGRNAASTIFLIVVAILDAGRNSMSFFMLLVVSLGLSVVRESLGSVMLRCQGLALAHFVFGILYAIGIVELELESTSALVLLLFIIPLAFTLSGFLLWIMYALNATIAQLRSRKQHYKLRMFKRLYHILIFAVVIIALFFVVSSVSFSSRLAEDYAAKSWKVRWWLLDGWLALLYLVVFVAISFLWRPSENNRRLAMSDEVAQDEEDVEDYDLDSIEHRIRVREDDDMTLVGGRRGGRPDTIAEDHVVFEIGDEDEDEEENAKKRRSELDPEGNNHDVESERQRLFHDGPSHLT